jgi:hypothetical protein
MVSRSLFVVAVSVAVIASSPVQAATGSWDDARTFWSFQPPVDPALPKVSRTDWPVSPIDVFILARLEASGLNPAPRADKRTLIRRATFDLIGLPPTPEETDAFIADESPDGFARLIERLLASPRYGERWGRHWLDVARYSDSNGMDENLAYANAFRYRDWVIAAINADKPYDLFVREQIAGDLLGHVDSPTRNSPNVDNDLATMTGRIIATGFLSLGPKMLAEDDPVKMEMDIIDEQLDTIGRTFMGLTLGCARCHDHKFDPFSMADYYSLAGIFKSTKTMDNFKVVARWHEMPLGSTEQIAAQESWQQALAAKKSEFDRVTSEANETLVRDARRSVGKYLVAATALRREQATLASLKSALMPSEGQHPSLPTPLPSQRDDRGDTRPTPLPSQRVEKGRGEGCLGAIILEAEGYARGNVKRDFADYGPEIGVIYNQGELPNFAEFDVEITEPCSFQIELRYAAAESRPVRLIVNGQSVKSNAAAKTTGSWYPDTQAWSAEAIVQLRAGTNTIRLEREQPFPHFDKLALIPRESAGPHGGVPRTVEQIAAEAGLNPALVEQWSKYLDQTKDDPASALAAWHATTSLAAPVGSNALFNDLKMSLEHSLAARYQQLSDEADRAWLALQAGSAGNGVKALPDAAQESLRKLLYDPKGPLAVPPKPERFYPAETAAKWRGLQNELTALQRSFTPLPQAMALRDREPQNLRVHLRGSHLTLGDEVARQFPRILTEETAPRIAGHESGRRELAEWLTRPNHALTSRVMANRLWHWHFGAGLVRTTDNFGTLGEPPSHPTLLDWLALRFVESGWSIKAMHRSIMLSATYQMSTAYNEQAAQIDPDNRLLWRMNRRRLEAEAIRDSILAVSGQLDLTMGGTLLDSANRAYVKGYPNSVYDKYDFNRRSVYLPILRSMVYDVFQAFDFADPSTPNGERATTTVAPQALFMLNSKLMADQTRHWAEHLLADTAIDNAHRVRLIYERAFGRLPSEIDTARAADFLRRYESALELEKLHDGERRVRAWQALCRSVLASSEFVYLE